MLGEADVERMDLSPKQTPVYILGVGEVYLSNFCKASGLEWVFNYQISFCDCLMNLAVSLERAENHVPMKSQFGWLFLSS